MPIQDKLPNKLSSLLSVALKEFLKIESDPRFEINMTAWVEYNPRVKRCQVCFAGAALVGRCGVSRKRADVWGDDLNHVKAGSPLGRKASALNELRVGDIHAAAHSLGIALPRGIHNQSVAEYAISPEGWKKDIRKLIQYLRDHNL